MKSRLPALVSFSLLLIASQTVRAQHGHLNAGALGTNQNDPLYFANGADFLSSSGYVKTLTYTNAGTYAGYFQGNITLTALPTTAANAGPDPAAPAPGSFIQAQVVSVEGPAGGAFAFWETGATQPSFSVSSGSTATNLFLLSESDGSPGSDPFGHFHGRRFTATAPGIYLIGFKLFDTSTNGVGGGPIHTPSEVLQVYFQAGVNLQSIEPDVDHTHVRFAAPAGASWQLEAADTPTPLSNWTAVGGPVVGDDFFHEIEDDHPVEGLRFYRVRSTTP